MGTCASAFAQTSGTRADASWVIPPVFLLSALVFAAAMLAIWWTREQRMAGQRKRIKVLNTLGEDVFASTTHADLLRKLLAALPKISDASGIGLYVYHRGVRILESVHTGAALAGPLTPGVTACFRDRALISISDIRRSPLFKPEDRKDLPKSVLFVPMLAQGEALGVVTLEHSGSAHFFSQEEQAAMQHLANQMATALKLQEQQSIREQLFRSEKLAAAGQLISGVANELRAPLEAIVGLAAGGNAELDAIAAEARRASDIVGRLVSFARAEQSEAEPVDLNDVLQGLGRFRSHEWKSKGIEAHLEVATQPVIVLGSRAQLEQVFLNLILEAEQCLLESREKTLAITSSALARRALVEISYHVRADDAHRGNATESATAPGALSLGVCHGLIQSHGGEIRLVRPSPYEARFEVELPAMETGSDAPSTVVQPSRPRELTVLIVEPDARVQREIMAILAGRGDRVVPVASAEEGADLAGRIRFDVTFCAVRLPGLNWVEFLERVRHQVGSFVLLTEGYDADLARAFQGGEGYVLSKPVDANELLRICGSIGERAPVFRG